MLALSCLLRRGIVAALLALVLPAVVAAEGLRVSPVSLEVTAPGATTSLTLRNEGRETITVQARVFRWVQRNGRETLERTQDVVVSPPMTRLAPRTAQTIRVVRTGKSPVVGEEAYRVIIDEVPDRAASRGQTVAFATELRIPVFFVSPVASLPAVRWSLRETGAGIVLQAQNRGEMRLRLADLRLGQDGKVVLRRDGLLGYVLGGSVMQWNLGGAARGINSLTATTNFSIINAPVARQ
ncbi:MAG: molecular chaperone [Pseudorhodobacter sp.]|nr:molecular chaperone [Pseudorhodobacter sp.]